MSVKIIRDILLEAVGTKVAHYKAPKNWADKYAVFGETAAPTTVSADDIPQELTLAGEIFFYTKEEFDKTIDRICLLLSRNGISWNIVAIGYDQDLEQQSYQIHWEVPCGAGEIY